MDENVLDKIMIGRRSIAKVRVKEEDEKDVEGEK